ncbi:hypothetical protein CDIK_3141 [Cucumispora dikerogammari]|nr:hypothetical protein CDIK_3141 [Cucumispora dikerogammari]
MFPEIFFFYQTITRSFFITLMLNIHDKHIICDKIRTCTRRENTASENENSTFMKNNNSEKDLKIKLDKKFQKKDLSESDSNSFLSKTVGDYTDDEKDAANCLLSLDPSSNNFYNFGSQHNLHSATVGKGCFKARETTSDTNQDSEGDMTGIVYNIAKNNDVKEVSNSKKAIFYLDTNTTCHGQSVKKQIENFSEKASGLLMNNSETFKERTERVECKHEVSVFSNKQSISKTKLCESNKGNKRINVTDIEHDEPNSKKIRKKDFNANKFTSLQESSKEANKNEQNVPNRIANFNILQQKKNEGDQQPTKCKNSQCVNTKRLETSTPYIYEGTIDEIYVNSSLEDNSFRNIISPIIKNSITEDISSKGERYFFPNNISIDDDILLEDIIYCKGINIDYELNNEETQGSMPIRGLKRRKINDGFWFEFTKSKETNEPDYFVVIVKCNSLPMFLLPEFNKIEESHIHKPLSERQKSSSFYADHTISFSIINGSQLKIKDIVPNFKLTNKSEFFYAKMYTTKIEYLTYQDGTSCDTSFYASKCRITNPPVVDKKVSSAYKLKKKQVKDLLASLEYTLSYTEMKKRVNVDIGKIVDRLYNLKVHMAEIKKKSFESDNLKEVFENIIKFHSKFVLNKEVLLKKEASTPEEITIKIVYNRVCEHFTKLSTSIYDIYEKYLSESFD